MAAARSRTTRKFSAMRVFLASASRSSVTIRSLHHEVLPMLLDADDAEETVEMPRALGGQLRPDNGQEQPLVVRSDQLRAGKTPLADGGVGVVAGLSDGRAPGFSKPSHGSLQRRECALS